MNANSQQCCLGASEKENQHQDHYREAFEQSARNGSQCIMHQVRPVVDGNDLHSRRQPGAVQLFTSCAQGPQHLAGVLAASQQHDPLHAAAVVVPAENAGLSCMADSYRSHVADEHGHTSGGEQYNVLDFGHRTDPSDAANYHRLLPGAQECSSCVPVVGLDGIHDVLEKPPPGIA